VKEDKESIPHVQKHTTSSSGQGSPKNYGAAK
jgi:hypothetical protein